jgi:proline iminopeptidase
VPEGADTLETYVELLRNPDEEARLEAARAWSRWEFQMVNVFPDEEALQEMLQDPSAVSTAHIESYYTLHDFFMESDNYILDNAHVIAHIPTRIVHGRYDTICPPISAWELDKALPNARLTLVANGAHSPLDGDMTKHLVAAADEFRDLGL